MKKYCLNVTCVVKPERREEFLAAIRANQRSTHADEPLAVLYTLGESTTQPNTFYLQEQYQGHEGFTAHVESAHFAKWKEFANAEDSPFASPLQVDIFEEFAVDFDTTIVHAPPAATEGNKSYCLNVDFYVKPEKREAFVQALSAVQRRTVADETQTRVYTWGENVAHPNTFHVQEQYTDLAGFNAHAQSEYFARFAEFAFNKEDSPFEKDTGLFFFNEI